MHFIPCHLANSGATNEANGTHETHSDGAAERLLFEQMLGYGNHLGQYARQTGPSGEALGNFPQACTHLALIRAAFNPDRTPAGG